MEWALLGFGLMALTAVLLLVPGGVEKTPIVMTLALFLSGLLMLIFNIWGWAIIASAVLFFVLCFKKIPARPPFVGLVTIRGERKPIIKREGWRLVSPFFPFFYDVLLVNVRKRNRDFAPKNVRTSERAELEIEISITWIPDKENGRNLIEYINAGEEEGVNNILDDVIEEAVRVYAIEVGWEKCLAANAAVAQILVQKITGLTAGPEIEAIRRGNGIAKVPTLGIILNRLNIGTIWVKGALAEAAEKVAKENREQEAEKIEMTHVRERIKELIEDGIPPDRAADLVQTERGKVQRRIQEFRGIDLEALGRAIGEILRRGG